MLEQEKLKGCLVEVSEHMNELEIRKAEELLLDNPKQFLSLYDKMKSQMKLTTENEQKINDEARR